MNYEEQYARLAKSIKHGSPSKLDICRLKAKCATANKIKDKVDKEEKEKAAQKVAEPKKPKA